MENKRISPHDTIPLKGQCQDISLFFLLKGFNIGPYEQSSQNFSLSPTLKVACPHGQGLHGSLDT